MYQRLNVMNKYREFLKNTGGDPNAVVNDAYTHFSVNGTQSTKVAMPDNPYIIVTIETRRSGNRLTGSVRQFGADVSWDSSPLNAFLTGPISELKTYFNAKAHGQKLLPSWLDRALSDHVNHFYC